MSSWETVAKSEVRRDSEAPGSVCLSSFLGGRQLPLQVAFPICLFTWSPHMIFPTWKPAFLHGGSGTPKAQKQKLSSFILGPKSCPDAVWAETNQRHGPQGVRAVRAPSGDEPPQRGWFMLIWLVLLRMERESTTGNLRWCFLERVEITVDLEKWLGFKKKSEFGVVVVELV